MAFLIHTQHNNLDNISNLNRLTRMLQAAAGDFGDVHQAILMNADVHKNTKVNHVTYRASQLHARL